MQTGMCVRCCFIAFNMHRQGHFLSRIIERTSSSSSKYSKNVVKKLISLNKENQLLFGPILKVQNSRKSKKGKKSKNKTKEGLSLIVQQAQNEAVDVSYGCQWNNKTWEEDSKPEPHLTAADSKPGPTTKVIKSKKRSVLKAESSSKLNPVSNVSKTELDPLPVFDFILNAPMQGDFNMAVDPEFNSAVEQMSLRNLPTVSRILNYTQSALARFYLQRWKEKSIAEMGKEAFYLMQEETMRNGINLHACIQQFLSGQEVADIQIQPRTEGYWQSLQPVLHKVSQVQALEREVTHPHLLYRGKYDCLAMYNDSLCVIDWKTSQKPKPLVSNLFDNPLQIAAYLGAITAGTDITQQCGLLSSAVIVIAYPWGEPAHVHHIKQEQCQEFWRLWLVRLHTYWNSVARERGLGQRQRMRTSN